MSIVIPNFSDLDVDIDQASDRLIRARTNLMNKHEWYGNLTLRLRTQPTLRVRTLSTNGTYMFWNPNFVAKQDDQTLIFGCAHEVQHVALLHPYRVGLRNLKIANIAADYIVNEWLEKAGFILPDWVLRDRRFDGMYFEQVYATLEKEHPELAEDPNAGCDPGGEFLPAPTANDDGDGDDEGDNSDQDANVQPKPKHMTAADWEIAVEEASMLARKAGNMPLPMDAYINGARESKHDWRSELRRFMDYISPTDFSWATPNRAYLGQGYILPGVKRESLPRIGIAIDTSGSVYQELLNIFGEEVQAIVRECRPDVVEVVYCSEHVNNVEEFSPDDTIIFHPKDRGGTKFMPAINHFNDNPPVAVLYFTDGDNFNEVMEEPNYPVMWVLPESEDKEFEFGEVIHVSQY